MKYGRQRWISADTKATPFPQQRREAPAQINLCPGDSALLAQVAKLQEDFLDEDVAFNLHIVKRHGDKDADLTFFMLWRLHMMCRFFNLSSFWYMMICRLYFFRDFSSLFFLALQS
jgi:hypothetical protein